MSEVPLYRALIDVELNCPEAKTCGCKSATLSVMVNGNEVDTGVPLSQEPPPPRALQ